MPGPSREGDVGRGRRRDRDANTAWATAPDGTLEERVYVCQNWRADVVALLDDTGARVERARYSSYGVPFGIPQGGRERGRDGGLIGCHGRLQRQREVGGPDRLRGRASTSTSTATWTRRLGDRHERHRQHAGPRGALERSDDHRRRRASAPATPGTAGTMLGRSGTCDIACSTRTAGGGRGVTRSTTATRRACTPTSPGRRSSIPIRPDR
jgi:hypothetical protein